MLDQYVAMLRANGCDNDLIVKIAASELKKTVEMTNYMKAEIKKLKKKGSDGVTEEWMAKFTKETVKGT